MTAAPARLGDVVALNPSAPRGLLATQQEVAIVPMAAVSETGAMVVHEHRPANEVSPGLSYFENGDVVVAKITPCYENNKIALAAVDRPHAFGSTEFHVLRPDERRVDARYLVHFLRQDSVRDQGTRRMTGSAGQRRVPRSFLEELAIPLPSLDEQRRIASILDQADTLRTKRRRARALLVQFAQSCFSRMTANRTGSWASKPLSEICIEINDCPHTTPKWTSAGVTCVRTSNLGHGEWDWSDHRFVSREDYEARSARGFLQPGDIVLSREGTIGVLAIVPPRMEMCMGQRLVQVRPDPRHVRTVYLLQFLLGALSPEKIQSSMTGSTSKHLNLRDLRSLEVPLPPLEAQLEFEAMASEAHRLKDTSAASERYLSDLFNSLQHSAFRGEL